MTGLMSDIRQAGRSLARTPIFTIGAVLTLALGIGATTTLIGVLDTLLFRPPAGVTAPGEIARPWFVFQGSWGGWNALNVSYPDFTDLRDKAKSFASVAAYYTKSGSSLGRGAEAEEVRLTGVTGGFFALLGTRPALGRFVQEADDRLGAPADVVVLSHAFWQHRFGGDPAIIGRQLPLADRSYTVIGVAPEGFTGGELEPTQAWVPLSGVVGLLGDSEFAEDRGSYFLYILTRLKPGVSLAQAQAEASTVIDIARADTTIRNGYQRVVLGPVQRARGPETSGNTQVAIWLVGVSIAVLLVACANVANLLLARGLARSRELAIRKALGAGRGRILRQLTVESVVLGLIGGAGALLLAVWGGGLVRTFLLPAGIAGEFPIDLRLCLVLSAVSLVSGVAAGTLPALRAAKGDLTPVLKEGSAASGYRRSRLRSGLVAVQVTLSVMLVVGAGLFVRSLRAALDLDLGYDLDRVVRVNADLSSSGFKPPELLAAYTALAETARQQPGVESVSLTHGEPFGWAFGVQVRMPGVDSLPRFTSGGPYINGVQADFFRTMGLSLTRGRGWTEGEGAGTTERVAVVGSSLAQRYWPDGNAIGQCLLIGAEAKQCSRVVGVVEDARRNSVVEEVQPLIYIPLAQVDGVLSHLAMFIRTRGPAEDQVNALGRILQQSRPDLPYLRVEVLKQVVAPQYGAWRLGATMFTLFGVLALTLASIGIYSVLAYAVRGRRQELGIRLALGAPLESIVSLVVRDGVRMVVPGLVLGLVGALAAGRALRALLYGVSPTDPLVLVVTLLVMALAGLAASAIPARRAAKVNPMTALRSD